MAGKWGRKLDDDRPGNMVRETAQEEGVSSQDNSFLRHPLQILFMEFPPDERGVLGVRKQKSPPLSVPSADVI